MMLTPTLTPTGARNGAVRRASMHVRRIQTPDSEAGDTGFEARLPLQLRLATHRRVCALLAIATP